MGEVGRGDGRGRGGIMERTLTVEDSKRNAHPHYCSFGLGVVAET